jgi:iodotyrosine deiodinase
MSECEYVPLIDYREYPVEEMQRRAADFHAEMKRRRTVRTFADRPVPASIIKECILAACRAPSGANHQPWTFVAVSDPAVKTKIRAVSEKVEQEFYSGRATRQWVQSLNHLGTNRHKPFLETASYLIVIFAQRHGYLPNGEKKKHYYVQESVGIATGMLITALHHTGLATLTYTPAKMGFLNRILSRPSNEKPFMILVTGYPEKDTMVPAITKKVLEEVAVFL